MDVLVVDDDMAMQKLLPFHLRAWGHTTRMVANGATALDVIVADPPDLAIVDWLMPGLNGPELCRRVRSRIDEAPYMILLSSLCRSDHRVDALDAGADDYVTKPFDPSQLEARLRAAERTIRLRQRLSSRVVELEATLARTKRLEGIIPICSYCKCIRKAPGMWQEVAKYVQDHSDARFSHGVCPTCLPHAAEGAVPNMTSAST